MKINKIASKLLVVSMILSNLSTISNASTLEDRYETLEGEYITIDDSEEEILEEIDIFGNTVQDENNLQDIQSVGDLYVDEYGSPILDSQGREQYKIDIISYNARNLFPNYILDSNHFSRIENKKQIRVDNEYIIYEADGNWTGLTSVNIPIKKGRSYSCVVDIVENTLDENDLQMLGAFVINIPSSSRTGVFYTTGVARDDSNQQIAFKVSNQNKSGMIKFRIAYYEGVVKNIIEPQENKIEILLPCQLQKAGIKQDRLYWDSEKNRYIIEKNVYKFEMNGIDNFPYSYKLETKDRKAEGSSIVSGYTYINRDAVYSAHLGWGSVIGLGSIEGYSYNAPQYIRIYIDTSIHTEVEDDLESINNFINNHPFYVYGARINSQLIETNITSKLKVPTYEGKTYIYVETENKVNPTLKVTVDRLSRLSGVLVEDSIVHPSVENISLARMYVNMLPESLYKDELQAKLNELLNLDNIQIDKKSVTSSVDIYIKSKNSLIMTINTNNIVFEDYSGVEDIVKENAITLQVSSSLPYNINSYLMSEMHNADKTKMLDKSVLNIKDSSSLEYKAFSKINEKVVLKDNCDKGNNNVHNIDMKLKGRYAHEADVYKTAIKLEVEQI